MITSAVRATVSIVTFAVASSAVLTVGGCSRAASPDTWNGAVATPGGRLAIRFENEAQTYVDVYLVSEQREWRLGRVAPGARVVLRLPEQALATSAGFLRLAVLANSPYAVQAARDPHAVVTIAQPVSRLLSQEWTFWPRPLSSPEVLGTIPSARP